MDLCWMAEGFSKSAVVSCLRRRNISPTDAVGVGLTVGVDAAEQVFLQACEAFHGQPKPDIRLERDDEPIASKVGATETDSVERASVSSWRPQRHD